MAGAGFYSTRNNQQLRQGELAGATEWGEKEGRSAYGLLGSDVQGIGGHGLRGLNLLLDNGRHLPLDQYSIHTIPLKFQSIPWLNYLRICLFCRASARWCEV
jgi:hypothetical protein